MKTDYLLKNEKAKEIYDKIKDLPIVDYHCHLSAKEIFEDRQFENIGQMWLSGDHYKWRLMRCAGIDEKYITGDASYIEKFIHYAVALEFAAGNPLYHWSHMELSKYFDINAPLNRETALKIYDDANRYIKENRLSPRKLIERSRVEVICTTDDITDDLYYHEKLANDSSFKTRVLPSFRTDNLLLITKPDWIHYIKKLAVASKIEITNLNSLKNAITNRLQYFIRHGCKFTDVGIPYFPNKTATDADADTTLKAALKGEEITHDDYMGFLGNMYLFLAELYSKNDLVMQLHLAVNRNANTALYNTLGADCGVDCIGDSIRGDNLINLLDKINSRCEMPRTIIYTLNPSNAEQLASIAGAFRNVSLGAAWWFCDHERGIKQQLQIIAENSSLGLFPGMLTDSRSFLSYARHDYFRRILSTMLGEWAQNGEYDDRYAVTLAEKISYYNAKEMLGKS